MSVLIDKSYRNYNYFSRYASYPYYYNTIDKKYIYGTTSQLKDSTPYVAYTVKAGDTYDSISLEFYNNPTYYYLICDFNHIQDPLSTPVEGSILRIPSFSTVVYTSSR